jgi:hypothetical protein
MADLFKRRRNPEERRPTPAACRSPAADESLGEVAGQEHLTGEDGVLTAG